MINFADYTLMRDPIILKKTGTVVKWYKHKTMPNNTMKEVLIGPFNNSSKISRSWLLMNNKQPEKFITRDFSIGAVTETLYKKASKGWEKIKAEILS